MNIYVVRVEKIVKGKQCTVIWHTNYLKLPHVDSNIVSSIIADIDAEYGKSAKMTITRGKIHKYLGMTIDYYLPLKMNVYMVYYIVNIPDDIQEDMRR